MPSNIAINATKTMLTLEIDRTQQTSITEAFTSIPTDQIKLIKGSTATDVLIIKDLGAGVLYKLDIALGVIDVNSSGLPPADNEALRLAILAAL